ncbi:quinoprotein relay system zinc metallohydrolase 1 [uncultured Neptuniibacter sp.]|uniref:quinoprotein relay system zinc metallohydrolase 1 n=1 Tax=uncultured Neptuniibacter sp. TaxID=502143 RepID=UPI00260B164F|nr:quinoprotein relay system zinc metallohydrolase 1 [uncultured Neptuniibacter sp.]
MRNLVSFMIAIISVLSLTATAAPLEYKLQAEQVAEDTWVLVGKLEDFSNKNGGNIVNTGFIVTDEGVVVIDTGPSLKYGRAMRKVIATVTDKPIRYVFNTHHHPDHFLGNQAFSDLPILSLPKTKVQLAQHGDAFAENMYRMIGDWMRSTEVKLPTETVEPGVLALGGHELQLMAYSGHTGSDLVIFDKKTGVLFSSDIVFYQRALTTPHTPGLKVWLEEIREMKAFNFKLMVPGHGPVVKGMEALEQMEGYLAWLDETLSAAAESGMSMTEVIRIPIKEEYRTVALSQREFERTVAHIYARYEEAVF